MSEVRSQGLAGSVTGVGVGAKAFNLGSGSTRKYPQGNAMRGVAFCRPKGDETTGSAPL